MYREVTGFNTPNTRVQQQEVTSPKRCGDQLSETVTSFVSVCFFFPILVCLFLNIKVKFTAFTDGEHKISLKLYQVFAGSLHKPEQYLSHPDDTIRTEYTDQFASTEGNILKHFGIIQNSAFSWLISTP